MTALALLAASLVVSMAGEGVQEGLWFDSAFIKARRGDFSSTVSARRPSFCGFHIYSHEGLLTEDPFLTADLSKAIVSLSEVKAEAFLCLSLFALPKAPDFIALCEQQRALAFKPSASGYGSVSDGRFVKRQQDLIHRLLLQFPQSTGVLLDLRLPNSPLYAYSAATRSRYIRHSGLDPLDLPDPVLLEKPEGASFDQNAKLLHDFLRWREEESLHFARSMAEIVQKSGKQIGFVIYPGHYRLALPHRMSRLQPWLLWLMELKEAKIVFASDRESDDFAAGLRHAADLLRTEGVDRSVSVLLSEPSQLARLPALNSLFSRGASVVVRHGQPPSSQGGRS